MALVISLARKIKRSSPALPLFLRSIVFFSKNPAPLTFLAPSSPTLFYCSPTAKTHIQRSSPSLRGYSISHYHHESSDCEAEERETLDYSLSGLRQLIDLLYQAKHFLVNEKAIAFLQESGVQPTEDLVYAAIWELRGEWKLAFLAFSWGEKFLGNSLRCWNLMIWILGKEKRFDMAWKLLREMHEMNMNTREVLLIMIKRYAAANEPSKAVRTFHAFEKFKISADITDFFTLLRALCKHKNIEEAEELIFLNKKLFPLVTESFNIILDGWCNTLVDVAEAKRIWREMSNCCIHPDGISYTHMISCNSKVGNLFESLRLYDEMKKRGWVPGILVYNSLIAVLTKENCMNEARKILSKIVEAGLKPNADSYNSIIYPLCEAKRLEDAWNVLDEMITSGVSPTEDTFHAFANVENMEKTLKLISQMKEAGCGPNGATFLLVFEKLFKWGSPGDVLRMWTIMGRHNVVPELDHYIILVEGLAKCGWLNKAREFYHEMKLKGFPEDARIEMILRAPRVSRENCGKQWRQVTEPR